MKFRKLLVVFVGVLSLSCLQAKKIDAIDNTARVYFSSLKNASVSELEQIYKVGPGLDRLHWEEAMEKLQGDLKDSILSRVHIEPIDASTIEQASRAHVSFLVFDIASSALETHGPLLFGADSSAPHGWRILDFHTH